MAKTIEEKVDALIRGVGKVLNAVSNSNSVSYRPASTNFYSPKGGQLQFAVGVPTWKEPELKNGQLISYVEKEGAVFIEAAPPDPNTEGKLDWKGKKIVFALGDKDIAAIVNALTTGRVDKNGNLVNITHTTGSEDSPIVKYFKIRPGKDSPTGEPTYGMEVADMSTKNKVSVFVGAVDLTRLRLLLASAMPRILGWDRV